jgi:hypothetical protein
MSIVTKVDYTHAYLERNILHIYQSSKCLKQKLYTFSVGLMVFETVEQITFLNLCIWQWQSPWSPDDTHNLNYLFSYYAPFPMSTDN